MFRKKSNANQTLTLSFSVIVLIEALKVTHAAPSHTIIHDKALSNFESAPEIQEAMHAVLHGEDIFETTILEITNSINQYLESQGIKTISFNDAQSILGSIAYEANQNNNPFFIQINAPNVDDLAESSIDNITVESDDSSQISDIEDNANYRIDASDSNSDSDSVDSDSAKPLNTDNSTNEESSISDLSISQLRSSNTTNNSDITANIITNENQTFVMNVRDHRENEHSNNDDEVSYSISGGADQALFSLNAETGELSFIQGPDFENPSDADSNNAYEIQVSVSNSSGLSDMMDIIINIDDTAET